MAYGVGIVTPPVIDGSCPRCGGSGIAPRVEPNEWSAVKWYACQCPAGDDRRELIPTDPGIYDGS